MVGCMAGRSHDALVSSDDALNELLALQGRAVETLARDLGLGVAAAEMRFGEHSDEVEDLRALRESVREALVIRYAHAAAEVFRLADSDDSAPRGWVRATDAMVLAAGLGVAELGIRRRAERVIRPIYLRAMTPPGRIQESPVPRTVRCVTRRVRPRRRRTHRARSPGVRARRGDDPPDDRPRWQRTLALDAGSLAALRAIASGLRGLGRRKRAREESP